MVHRRTARRRATETVIGRVRAAGALAAWLALVLSMVTFLHAVGGRLAPPPPLDVDGVRAWLEQRQASEVVFTVVRLLALVLGWYLAAVTIVSVVARLLRLSAAVTVVDAVTVPAVRRLVSSAVGLSLVTTGYPGMAAAETSPNPAVETPAVETPAVETPAVETMRRLPDRAPSTPEPSRSPSTQPEPTPPSTQTPKPTPSPPSSVGPNPMSPAPAPGPAPPVPTTRPAPPPTPPTTPSRVPASWPVRPGDHFWAVAERVLADAWGRPPTDAEVTPYWRGLVEANRARLADPANPDLLFPGQTLSVPPLPVRPEK